MWADGIHAKARLDDVKLCLLVLIGATEDGKKELIAVEDGYRESEALLVSYDFPAEHWVHIRTTNPLESTFATVRLDRVIEKWRIWNGR